MTLDQAKRHNQTHEDLLLCGYEWTFHPAEFDDGDPENGPGTWGCPAFHEYQNDDWTVIVQDGEVVYRERRDHEFEAWVASFPEEQP